MRIMFGLTMIFLLSAMTLRPSSTCARESDFQAREVKMGAAVYRYKVFVPNNWNKKKKWPVILFLHGAGERGDDNVRQTTIGLGPAILKSPESYPCVVVMPQCSAGRWWPEPDMQAQALEALEESVKEFNGDPERIYLTGLSMGGYGLWAIASNHPNRFAALAPICGGVVPPPRAPIPPATDATPAADPYRNIAEKVGKTPTWVFHGAIDPVVPVTESRKMVEALKAVGGNVRYNEYEGVGHNSWDRAYAEPDLITWLLAARLQSGKASSKNRTNR